jgi:type IV fimbrial biogenesis protein FimT
MRAMKHQCSRESSLLLGRGQGGFTLLELMVTVTILGILVALAVPMFRETILNNRIVTQNNEFISGLNFARSEAIKRSDTVSVCASSNGTSCSASTSWSTGWIVFTDLNADGAVNAGIDTVLQVAPATTNGITISSPTFTYVRYTSSGMLNGTAGNFSLLKTGCTGLTARQIDVSVTGRVSTTKVACP